MCVFMSPTNVWWHPDVNVWLQSIQGSNQHRFAATPHRNILFTLRKTKRYSDPVQPMSVDHLNYSFAISERVRSALCPCIKRVCQGLP